MNNELDKYLQALAHEIRGLPQAQRESELREMQQHLEAIVARLMEGGLSHEEAMEAALSQFGAARQVGRELDKASAPREPWWRILLAPMCGWACQNALHYPSQAAVNYLMPTPVNPSDASVVMALAVVWLASLSSGAVAGYISPRWGGGLLLCLMSRWVLVAPLPPDMLWRSMLGWLLVYGPAILVGSWLGGRLARRLQNTRASGPTEVA